MNSQIFPEAEDDGHGGGLAFVKIARFIDCDEDKVWNAFRGVDTPEWSVPSHLDAVKATTHKLNKAARNASNLARALRELNESERRDLILAGAVTLQQIQHLASVLDGDAKSLDKWLRGRPRTGGKNPAAYAVSEGMRRLFRRLRKPITLGVSEAGSPSTEFGRAVEFALGEFGLVADWRRPTEAARDKLEKIRGRMGRCAIAKARQNGPNADSE